MDQFYEEELKRVDQMIRNSSDAMHRYELGKYKEACGKVIMEECADLADDVLSKVSEGIITEEAGDEMLEDICEKIERVKYESVPWYEAAATVAGLAVAISETSAFLNNILQILPTGIGKLLTKPVCQFVKARLNRYPLLHPDVIDFNQFTKESYDVTEMDRFPHIKFKYTEKWAANGRSRIHCSMYKYKDKIVMGLAYSKDLMVGVGSNTLLEPVFIDSSLKKHEDYYVSCMSVALQVSHPAINRLMAQLKDEWAKKKKEMEKVVKEDAEDAVANYSFEERINTVMECAEDGRLDPEMADIYVKRMNWWRNRLSKDSFDRKIGI